MTAKYFVLFQVVTTIESMFVKGPAQRFYVFLTRPSFFFLSFFEAKFSVVGSFSHFDHSLSLSIVLLR